MMNKAMKKRLIIFSCLLILVGLFSINQVFGINYTVPANGDFLVVLSYPLWEAGGGATGNFNQQLQLYIQDLTTAGWNVKTLLVSTVHFILPTFPNCPTYQLVYTNPAVADWIELKTAIMSYLPNNCTSLSTNGLVLIGSAPHIPTVYWRYRERETNGSVGASHPTDLYYADRDNWEVWNLPNQSLAPDQPGATGNVYTFLDANGGLRYSGYEPMPDLICGRISAWSICSGTDSERLTQEAGKIAAYLQKIHNYRASGSPLSLEQRKTAILYSEDDFVNANNRTASDYTMAGEVAGRVLEYRDLAITNRQTFTKALESGSQFCFIVDHTQQDGFLLEEWPETNYLKGVYTFDLNQINAINPKVHLYYLFCCSACRYTTPNIGTTLLLNNDFTYNVLGKTSPDNVFTSNDLYSQLNAGENTGRAFYNEAYWLHANFHGNGSCMWLSSHILLGDPALTYTPNITNRPPMITTSLISLEAKVNTQFNLPLNTYDPDGDTVNITVSQINQSTLPTGAFFNTVTRTLSWIPTASQAGKTFYFRVTATDTALNTHQQDFTIYVNHFANALFDSPAAAFGWNLTGGGVLTAIPATIPGTNNPHPFNALKTLNKKTSYMIQVSNNYALLSQRISVQPMTHYSLGFYIGNRLTDNSYGVYVDIPQLNLHIPLYSKGVGAGHECEYFQMPVYTFNKSELDVRIYIGDSSNHATGEYALANVKLIDTKKPDTVYLSDMTYEVGNIGFGGITLDKNIFGHTLSLAGETFGKGIGTHANSTIFYRLAGQYARFQACIGVDDEMASGGPSSVVFEVCAEGYPIYRSSTLYANSPVQYIDLDVTNVNVLELRVTDNGDSNNSDLADWADAKLVRPTYLSDLNWVSATAGYTGAIQKDKSFGDGNVGFNNPITLNGVVYPKGIGTHADSTIIYNLNGNYKWFVSDVGIDDELDRINPPASYGEVRFEVWLDGVKQFDSGSMNNTSPTRHICLNVTNVNQLKLVVDKCGSDTNDHADWAGAALVKDTEHGLNAEYYLDKELFNSVIKKIDKTVDFDWGTSSPGPGLPNNYFSIRWTGKVKPDIGGTYTFSTEANDGVRLWVNGQKIIDYWYPNGLTTQNGTITLEAGKLYDIKLEYYEDTSSASAKLFWSCTDLPRAIIPATNLFTR